MGPLRPRIVGFVCWVLIISGSYIVYSSMKQLNNAAFFQNMQMYPYPARVGEVILYGTAIVAVICGILMYEGHGWARYPYLIVMIPFLAQTYFDLGILAHSLNLHFPAQARKLWLMKRLWDLGVLFYLCSILILFMRRTRRYFHPPLYVDE
jgi:hypothetical protein